MENSHVLFRTFHSQYLSCLPSTLLLSMYFIRPVSKCDVRLRFSTLIHLRISVHSLNSHRPTLTAQLTYVYSLRRFSFLCRSSQSLICPQNIWVYQVISSPFSKPCIDGGTRSRRLRTRIQFLQRCQNSEFVDFFFVFSANALLLDDSHLSLRHA